jgi:ribosomal protein S18 acetylase RimI-like enzyme
VVKRTLEQGAIVLVARIEQIPVGTLWITHDFRRAYIHHMAVKPQYQSLGIGRKLIAEATLITRKLGLQAKLEVHRDNPAARKIYSEAGFATLEGYLTMIKREI